MLLLLGLGTIFVSINQTSQLRQSLSSLQNNERLAMMLMQSSIQGAGYYPVVSGVSVANVASEFPSVVGSFTTAGQTLFGTTGTAGNPDTLSVRFYTDLTNPSAFQGCSGNLAVNTAYTDVFSIDTVNNNLVCTENAAPYTLIAGVSGMSALYGVDAPSGGSGSVTEYLTATQVTNSNYWSYVKTIQLTLVFTNPLYVSCATPPCNGQNPTISITQTIPYMISL